MVVVVDYGAVPVEHEKNEISASSPRKSNRAIFAVVASIAAFALVAMVYQVSMEDDGRATLAALKAQEINDILSKAKHMSTSQLQAEVDALEALKVKRVRTTSLSEDTEANPMGGILENVPATIVAPVPGPPDFNGVSAVVARLPNIGFAPSMLEEKGFESRGTFTVRQSRAGESFYLRIYGKLNHNLRCTIRGYRNLMGDFTGNTIYTGFKLTFTGKSQIHTSHIPRGIQGEFDIMTCRDLGNGEVQYFRIRYD
mmetsp:Transcript_41383/g.110744  ORF Transcript_41383/g.110744 Transcript_41383/m.110744 type:complete len:255 (+) Transcript_41383:50-814(+)